MGDVGVSVWFGGLVGVICGVFASGLLLGLRGCV